MSTDERPEWVIATLDKYVGKSAGAVTLPELGRNMQAEVTRIQAVIDVVTKYKVPETELVRLRNKTQDLLNILNAKQ
jgi:hypothetical protein